MSLNRVIVLGALALLSLLGYMFLVGILLEPWGSGALAGGLIGLLVLDGGWLWALLAASHGSHKGLVWVAIFSLVAVIAAASDLLVFCPTPCIGLWPLAEISHWSTLLTGLIAAGSVTIHLSARHRIE